eukprot:g11138.t1
MTSAAAGSAGSSSRAVAAAGHTSIATSAAKNFLNFANQTGSPYHAVYETRKMLLERNFTELSERDVPWRLQTGGKYFMTKLGSTICAFVVGDKFSAAEGGFVVCGAHTDSPCLRLRPNTKVAGDKNHVQVGVQTYGGGLWHTWFDRPLGLAGKVVVAPKENPAAMEERLLRIVRPILLLPNLAIHLQTADERKAFAVNPEQHLQPVLCCSPPAPTTTPAGAPAAAADNSTTSCTAAGASSSGAAAGEEPEAAATPSGTESAPARHTEELLRVIAGELNVEASEIVDMDLCLMDCEPGRFVGPNDDFIFSGRIDNLVSVWAEFDAITQYAETEAKKNSKDIAVCVAFDHEECGSESTAGADSSSLEQWLQQILGEVLDSQPPQPEFQFVQGVSQQPSLGQSMTLKPAIKTATTSSTHCISAAASTCIPFRNEWLRVIMARPDGKWMQDFVVRNDCPCGSTIGPMVSSNLGMRAVDLGIPQWAMHSCKESCSSVDIQDLHRFVLGAFQHFRNIDGQSKTL